MKAGRGYRNQAADASADRPAGRRAREFRRHLRKVVAIAAGGIFACQRAQLFEIDKAHAVGDLLDAAHFQALPLLDDADELAGLHQGLMRSGIEPGIAPPQLGDFELAAFRDTIG